MATDIISPADVRVGDLVRIEAIDGTTGAGPDWAVEGRITEVDPASTFVGLMISGRPHGFEIPSDSIVRLTHRPEPDPDPKAVEALTRILFEVRPTSAIPYEVMADRLVRRGVYVEVPDA